MSQRKGHAYINPVVPDANYGERVPDGAKGQIGDEKQEVAIVILAEAIVDPRAVVVHGKDALVAHLAVRGSRWLDFVANLARPRPNPFQVFRRFVSVLHHSLYLARNTFEPLFAVLGRAPHALRLRGAPAFTLDGFILRAVRPVFDRFPQLFDFLTRKLDLGSEKKYML